MVVVRGRYLQVLVLLQLLLLVQVLGGFLGFGAGLRGPTGAGAALFSMGLCIWNSCYSYWRNWHKPCSWRHSTNAFTATHNPYSSTTEPHQVKTQTLQAHKVFPRATSGQQSYAFAGPANTVGVGATVPLVYGKLLIGSHLLSSRVQVADDSNPTGEFFGITGGSSVRINGEKPGNKFKSLNGLRTRIWSDEQVRLASESGSEAKKEKARCCHQLWRDKQAKQSVVKEYDDDEDNQEKLQILLEINNGFSTLLAVKTFRRL